MFEDSGLRCGVFFDIPALTLSRSLSAFFGVWVFLGFIHDYSKIVVSTDCC